VEHLRKTSAALPSMPQKGFAVHCHVLSLSCSNCRALRISESCKASSMHSSPAGSITPGRSTECPIMHIAQAWLYPRLPHAHAHCPSLALSMPSPHTYLLELARQSSVQRHSAQDGGHKVQQRGLRTRHHFYWGRGMGRMTSARCVDIGQGRPCFLTSSQEDCLRSNSAKAIPYLSSWRLRTYMLY
jgi:hypothetical protein